MSDIPRGADWQVIDDWCKKQCDRLSAVMEPHIMRGGSLRDPHYRWQLGQHQALMRVRSFIHGSRFPTPAPLDSVGESQ